MLTISITDAPLVFEAQPLRRQAAEDRDRDREMEESEAEDDRD